MACSMLSIKDWVHACFVEERSCPTYPRILWWLSYPGSWLTRTPRYNACQKLILEYPCFCPWTFFQYMGFNIVPSDLFMPHLATQLGYFAGEFQALQVIVLATLGLTTCLMHVGPPFGNRFLNTSWAVGLTYWIVYLHFLYFDICIYICLYTSYHFLALSLLLKYSLFIQVLLY